MQSAENQNAELQLITCQTNTTDIYEDESKIAGAALAIFGIAFSILTNIPPVFDHQLGSLFSFMDFICGRLPPTFYLILCLSASVASILIFEIAKLVQSRTQRSTYLLVSVLCIFGAFSLIVNEKMTKFSIQVGSSTQISSSTLLWPAAFSPPLLLYLPILKLRATLHGPLAYCSNTNHQLHDPQNPEESGESGGTISGDELV